MMAQISGRCRTCKRRIVWSAEKKRWLHVAKILAARSHIPQDESSKTVKLPKEKYKAATVEEVDE